MWEYCTLYNLGYSCGTHKCDLWTVEDNQGVWKTLEVNFLVQMNIMGKKGWELVTCIGSEFIFKRKIDSGNISAT